MDETDLTDVQLEIMDLIWERGECAISDLWAELKDRRGVARNTVLTIVGRLEKKGWLQRTTEGRSHVFRARVDRQTHERQKLKRVVETLFQGSAEHLVRSLLGHNMIREDERQRLRKLLEESDS